MPDEITVGDFLIGILPRLHGDTSFPWWPPDCFGLCLALLKRTGGYVQLLRDWPAASGRTLDSWTAEVRELGMKWRLDWSGFRALANEWQIVCNSFGLTLGQVSGEAKLCLALMTIAVVADEAFKGVVAPIDQVADVDDMLDEGSVCLTQSGTLCIHIDPSRLRVLPRMHTPQNGLTERSLSRYLSLCDASEVTPQWQFSQRLASLQAEEARLVGEVLAGVPEKASAPPEVQATVDVYLAWVENNKRLRLNREARHRSSRGR